MSGRFSKCSATEQFDITSRSFLAGVVDARKVIEAAIAVLVTWPDAPEALASVASMEQVGVEGEVVRARAELALPRLSAADLAHVRFRTGLEDIVAGCVGPVEGAGRLWSERDEFGDPFGVLPELIQLLDQWETSLDEGESIDDEMRAVARRAIA